MSTLGFSFIQDTDSDKNIKNSHKKSRTLRKGRKKPSPSKIDNLLKSLSRKSRSTKEFFENKTVPEEHHISSDEEDDELSNFKPMEPLPRPSMTQQNDESNNASIMNYQPSTNMVNDNKNIEQDQDNAIENFAQLGEVTADEYYKQYVPYYQQMAGSEANVTNKDDLIKKLNYMIHLLEEQHDEKTSNVTEELVLYLFLGVFVIFVVDSFARAGKYTR